MFPVSTERSEETGNGPPRKQCTVCGGPLDPVLIDAGFTDHGEEGTP
jgi:hypothetical protein